MASPNFELENNTLKRELSWAHLKIQSLSEELRIQRIKFLGPRSETLNNLQLELLIDEEPGTTLDEVAAEAKANLPRASANRIPAANVSPIIFRTSKK